MAVAVIDDMPASTTAISDSDSDRRDAHARYGRFRDSLRQVKSCLGNLMKSIPLNLRVELRATVTIVVRGAKITL